MANITEGIIKSVDNAGAIGTAWIGLKIVILEEKGDEIKIKLPLWKDEDAFFVSKSILGNNHD